MTPTVRLLGVSKKLGMSDALETSWNICRILLFPSGLVNLTELIGAQRPYNCIYLVAKWRYPVCDVDFGRRVCNHDRGALPGKQRQ